MKSLEGTYGIKGIWVRRASCKETRFYFRRTRQIKLHRTSSASYSIILGTVITVFDKTCAQKNNLLTSSIGNGISEFTPYKI